MIVGIGKVRPTKSKVRSREQAKEQAKKQAKGQAKGQTNVRLSRAPWEVEARW